MFCESWDNRVTNRRHEKGVLHFMHLGRIHWQASSKAVWAAIALMGSAGLIYSCAVVSWHRLSLLVLLSILIACIEYFPIRVSQLTMTAALPIVYTIAAVSGFPAATIIVGIVVVIVDWLRRKPISTALVRIFSRTCGLMAAWAGTAFVLHPLTAGPKGLHYWELHLALSAVLITLVSNLLMYLYLYSIGSARRNLKVVAWLSACNTALTFLYDTLMLWLASSPNNTGSGNLGTVFFFLPLVACSIVAYLITNLIRTKSGLEKVMGLSEAMNRQATVHTLSRQMVKAALQLVEGDWYSLYVRNDDGHLTLETEGGVPFTELRSVHRECMERVVSSAKTALISDLPKELAIEADRRPFVTVKSLLIAPILADGQVVGVLTLGRRHPRAFRPDERRLLTIFAGHAGVAMNNALYMEEREKRLLVEERNRLAREIHDGIAQDLAGVLLQLEVLRRTSGAGVDSILEDIHTRLTHTVAAVRASIYELRPEPYVHIGLVRVLLNHVRDIEANHSLRIQFDANPADFSKLSPMISQTIYSTAVECIQNAIKHAHATTVSLRLSRSPKKIQLFVSDDGDGFRFGNTVMAAAGKQSFGIENLYRMANEIGAILEYETSPGQGTTIVLEVPWKEEIYHGNPHLAL